VKSRVESEIPIGLGLHMFSICLICDFAYCSGFDFHSSQFKSIAAKLTRHHICHK
jgi:hypothetical protein